MNFASPTLKQRGQLAQAMSAVQQFKPQAGEHKGKLKCPKCGGGLHFAIQSSGLSRGQCACGIRWPQ